MEIGLVNLHINIRQSSYMKGGTTENCCDHGGSSVPKVLVSNQISGDDPGGLTVCGIVTGKVSLFEKEYLFYCFRFLK